MLVPQTHRFLCQRCGCFLDSPTVFCSFCGARLALPWPGQQDRTGPAIPLPPVAPAPQITSTPLVVELLLNVLGIYGVGWLLIGNIGVGIPLLMCSVVLWPLVLLFAILTLGLVLLCLGPLGIGALTVNILLLKLAIKRKRRDEAAWSWPQTTTAPPGRGITPVQKTPTFLDHYHTH